MQYSLNTNLVTRQHKLMCLLEDVYKDVGSIRQTHTASDGSGSSIRSQLNVCLGESMKPSEKVPKGVTRLILDLTSIMFGMANQSKIFKKCLITINSRLEVD